MELSTKFHSANPHGGDISAVGPFLNYVVRDFGEGKGKTRRGRSETVCLWWGLPFCDCFKCHYSSIYKPLFLS